MIGSFDLKRYQTADGKVPISKWLYDLDDGAAARVLAYIDRMKAGNFGNSRSVGNGILELKIDFGPGYRVYYLRDGKSVVVLLCGGSKKLQSADILLAQDYAADYWRRR